MINGSIPEGLTFDDVLLLPGKSAVLPADTDTRTDAARQPVADRSQPTKEASKAQIAPSARTETPTAIRAARASDCRPGRGAGPAGSLTRPRTYEDTQRA